jgi:hypothetical protein
MRSPLMETGNGIIFAKTPENFRRGDVVFDFEIATNVFYISVERGLSGDIDEG